jgi:hypothetical protein
MNIEITKYNYDKYVVKLFYEVKKLARIEEIYLPKINCKSRVKA